jgi:hypothetical protein
MTELARGGLTERLRWWLGGLVGGALVGGLLASLGSVVLGLVFVLPFAAARGRAGAAIAGALAGSGLAAIVVHGISADIQTAAAAITFAAGLLLSGIALTKR